MGKRILVADDSRTIQKAFAMVMDGSGYTLSFARSVDEALSVARRDGRPDLVLSDAVLGAGSGYDLCAQLKAEAALGEVPVYILASVQNPYDEARGRKVGADGHLAKPFESQALLDAVASALTAPVARRSAVMPMQASDVNDSTSRYSEEDVAGGGDDSYGEITIERGPAAAPAANWATKPPTKSGARSLPAPTPTPPSQFAPRPPMIPPAPRPSVAMPTGRPGTTPQPMAGLPAPPAQARPPARTMMGFPSVKPPAAAAKPAVPAVAAPLAHTSTRPGPLPPATAFPARQPSFPAPASSSFPTPSAAAAPVVARPTPSPPSLPGPVPGVTARPAPPRFTPPPPAAPSSQAQPSTRRAITPSPDYPLVHAQQAFSAAVTSAVDKASDRITDKIDQKVAALSARGPEYEAIAKLSREIIEQVVWEVVPELAEAIIRQEVDRLASAKK